MSLPRILEPEWMDDNVDATEYDDMGHEEVNARFVDELIAGGPVGPDVLDLGTGTAQIPVILCERCREVRIFAVDAATSMLDLAVYNIEIAGLIDRIQLGQADAKKMTGFDDEAYDTVISNSLIHHLPEPLGAIQQAMRLARPGGRIFFRDLLRPDSAEEREALVARYGGKESDRAQQLFRQSFDAALTLLEIRLLASQAGVPAECVSKSSDRHWTLDFRKPQPEV